MKVLFTNEAPLIKYGLAEGFKQAGHEVYIIMGEENRLWSKTPEEQIRLINMHLDAFNPDMVFSEGFAGISIGHVYPEIRKRNIPIMYWAIEDPVTCHLADAHLPYVDYVFTTTIERLYHYKGHNLPSELLLFACNPEVHKNVGIYEQYKHDIVLVAANYSNRYDKAEWFIKPLLNHGYDIKIWGVWWDDPERPINLLDYPGIYQGILPYEELAKVYSSAKIVLGMNCSDASATQTSMRPYEVLGCGGGVYVGHFTQAVENIFGDKALQVKDRAETIRTIEQILNFTDRYDYRGLVLRGQDFVYGKHTYKHRAEQIVTAFDKYFGGK